MPVPPGAATNAALDGLLFMGGLEIAYNAYGSVCSSPQTTELFAGEREHTLMKYVWLADGKTLLLTGLISVISQRIWPLLGGLVATGMMHGLYRYAVNAARRRTREGAPAPAQTPPGSSLYSRPRQ